MTVDQSLEKELELLERLIEGSDNIVFFGGAGVSTESNIPDFRSQDGLYNMKYKYPPETMLSYSFFMDHMEEFFEFYRDKIIHPEAKPNQAHMALARLEKTGKLKAVITQNIDGLHQMAGSENVIELHGSVHRNYCMDCGEKYELSYILAQQTLIPTCKICGGVVRPDVVLYEEGLDNSIVTNAVNAILSSEMLIVGGSSLVVYPAAGFVRYHENNKLVLINKSETPYDQQACLVINDSIGEVLRRVIE